MAIQGLGQGVGAASPTERADSPPPVGTALTPGKPAAPDSFAVSPHFSFWPGRGCAGEIGWLSRTGKATTDASSQFRSLDAAAKAGKNILPTDANQYVYLFVGGIFTGLLPTDAYLGPNMGALRAHGLDARRVTVNTFQSSDVDSALIRDAVKKVSSETGKKIVLIGHSKGGVDCAAALSLYPELRDKVRAFVTMQSPFGGTATADDVMNIPAIKGLLGGVLQTLFNGSAACAGDLTYQSRRAFIAAHPLPAGIPTVCMATSSLSPLSPFFSTEAYLKGRYGVKSDGMVAPVDAFLPGSRTVTIDGMDHLSTTCPDYALGLPAHPEDLTEALIAMALTGY